MMTNSLGFLPPLQAPEISVLIVMSHTPRGNEGTEGVHTVTLFSPLSQVSGGLHVC